MRRTRLIACSLGDLYHQFHAVNAAVEETVRASGMVGHAEMSAEDKGSYWAGRMHGGKPGDRRAGVVWHTHGSGKSFSMLFYAGRIVRHPAMQNPTLVVLTDRNDLDDQLFGQFQRCHDLLGQIPVQADNRERLRELLKVASGGVVFTTIQKFLPENGAKMPALSLRQNIAVIADEAHRSQYGLIDGVARHMRDALPNASFIGFTGTPIEKTDANTRAVFGDYVSIYDIQRAVADKATVPIYYESRIANDSHSGLAVTARERALREVAKQAILPLRGKKFQRLSAERNVRMEQASSTLALGSNGHGATNIIRRYLTSSSVSADLISYNLLNALNQVFGADGRFTGIETKLHDEPQGPEQSQNHWEVFLGQEKKGLVALSRSGSGLKTVLLVLLNLILVPAFEGKKLSSYVFAFEELETHLHPTLLRRLLLYIEKFVRENEATVFLTTHSSVTLDLFGLSENAQLIHVQHDQESATTTTVKAHFDRVGIVAELGVKPSDLLHANGIIWVEGPSDRVYVNRWIDVLSSGELKEGRDYTCAMYGGALLARSQLVAPDKADAELSNLLSINSNIIVLCDGDQTAAEGDGAKLKPRVERIRDEVESIPKGVIWITAAKEIENYLPADALREVFPGKTLRAPGQFERFFPSEVGDSFSETELGRKSIDKVELATSFAPYLTTENLIGRFDWKTQSEKMIETIRAWNH